ncbi:hypothetical protein [Desulfovibrio piger]
MAIFFALLNRTDKQFNAIDNIQKYYEEPLFFKKNATIQCYRTKRCLLFTAERSCGTNIIYDHNNYTFIQGLYNKSISNHLHSSFVKDEKIDFKKINMPCTTVSINEERIRAFSSLAGMEHCYFFENKNYLAFSNRIGIFSCLENLTIDYYALSKLILKGHMIDESTCYHEVKKLQPGQCISLRYGERIAITSPPYKEIADDRYDINDCLTIFDNTLFDYYDYITSKEKRMLKLSGGKDSRAVLSIIDFFGGLNDKLFLTTSGAIYSPEVLAAKNLFEKIKKYNVNWTYQHSFYQKYTNITENIAKAFISNEGLLGFFAMDRLGIMDGISFGGHEIAFKYRKNKLAIDKYYEYLMGYIDYNSLLLPEYKEKFLSDYIEKTINPVFSNVPLDKYHAYHDAFLRVPYAVAGVTSSMHNLYSKFINPLIDFNFTRLLLTVDQKYIDSQFFLYYLTLKSKNNFASLPFCNDNWPAELLNLASKHHLNTDALLNKATPFYFDNNLPEHRHRTDYLSKNIVFNMIKRLLPSYINDFCDYFPMINCKKILSESQKDIKKLHPSMIPCLSAFVSACLVIENKQNFFKLDSINTVKKNISLRIKDEIKNENIETYYINKLNIYSESIAEFMLEKRQFLIDKDKDFIMLSTATKLGRTPWVQLVKIPADTAQLQMKGRIVRHPDLKNKLPVLLSIFSNKKNIYFNGSVYNENLKLNVIPLLKRDGEEIYSVLIPLDKNLDSIEIHIMSFGETYMIGKPEFVFINENNT